MIWGREAAQRDGLRKLTWAACGLGSTRAGAKGQQDGAHSPGGLGDSEDLAHRCGQHSACTPPCLHRQCPAFKTQA